MILRARLVRSSLVGFAMLALCAGTPACEGFFSSSKIASGETYHSDDRRYDPYFDEVHQQQVAANAWPDEKKTARHPIITALSLAAGASDITIVNATRDRAKKLGSGGAKLDLASAHVTPVGGATDAPFFSAIEETVRLELERARKLKSAPDKLEDLAKRGEELKKTADHEYENRGADKADEKKTEKSREIRRELGGAVDALRSLARDAGRSSNHAQDFLDDLEAAIELRDAPPHNHDKPKALPAAPPPPPPPPPPPKEDPKPAPVAKPKPSPAAKPKPAAAPAEKPAPAEAPPTPPPAKPAPPPDEVFNP